MSVTDRRTDVGTDGLADSKCRASLRCSAEFVLLPFQFTVSQKTSQWKCFVIFYGWLW